MIDRPAVYRWVEGYEHAWRTAGTDELSALFTTDATYLHSPYEEPVRGLAAIGVMWDQERDGPDEVFSLTTHVVAVENDTAVVRADVRYGQPLLREYRDLWILQFQADGRCSWFEEWPFWPGRPYAAQEEPYADT